MTPFVEAGLFAVSALKNSPQKKAYEGMDNKTLLDRYRQQFTNLHALTVLIISLLEIVGYIVLILSKMECFSLKSAYLWCDVVLPIVINTITHFVAKIIVNNPSVSRARKNRSIITAALVTAFVVAVIHREYIVTSCAFIFPMVLSAAFSDRKLLNTSFLASLFILLCVGGTFWLEKAVTLTTGLNLLILIGLAWVSYLCGVVSINFSKQNYTTIESQAQQNDRLMENVRKDQMTGLYNHNTFITQLDEMLANYNPHAPLCLAMIDVDDFKQINDTFGHDCGDTILIDLANILQKHCGIADVAYRYGGEEFAIVFKGKSKSQAYTVLNTMLAEFSSCTFPFTDASVTFSAGIAAFKPGTTRDAFFEAADQTLYLAKRQGKNRVLIARDIVHT